MWWWLGWWLPALGVVLATCTKKKTRAGGSSCLESNQSMEGQAQEGHETPVVPIAPGSEKRELPRLDKRGKLRHSTSFVPSTKAAKAAKAALNKSRKSKLPSLRQLRRSQEQRTQKSGRKSGTGSDGDESDMTTDHGHTHGASEPGEHSNVSLDIIEGPGLKMVKKAVCTGPQGPIDFRSKALQRRRASKVPAVKARRKESGRLNAIEEDSFVGPRGELAERRYAGIPEGKELGEDVVVVRDPKSTKGPPLHALEDKADDKEERRLECKRRLINFAQELSSDNDDHEDPEGRDATDQQHTGHTGHSSS